VRLARADTTPGPGRGRKVATDATKSRNGWLAAGMASVELKAGGMGDGDVGAGRVRGQFNRQPMVLDRGHFHP
jgi:hypothetical protein